MKNFLSVLLAWIIVSSASGQDSTINNLNKEETEIKIINKLMKTADNEKYGFTADVPVKVGKGPKWALRIKEPIMIY